jgi:hypothetical protein
LSIGDVLIPVWRLREIRNIADTMAYRAAHCPVGRLAMVAEKNYLKDNAHIRFLVDPKLKIDGAYHYIQILKNAEHGSMRYKTDLIKVTICFNGDLSTKSNWRKTSAAILTQLAQIIFFSEATKRLVVVADEQQFINDFVNYVLKKHPFKFDSTNRPRLMYAHLQEITKKDLHKKTKMVLRDMKRLLMIHLGPDGW